jgi:thiamine-phosphate pyrophosphorylase
VRAKRLSSGAFLDLCDAVVALGAAGAVIIVNDRADLARLSGARGVHVGQGDLQPASVRALVGPEALVGLSTHSAEQVTEAASEPVDYIAVGPVFDTRTKDTGYVAVGLALVSEAVGSAGGRPVVAIGGITLDAVPGLLAAGASGVAVIGDLLTGGDPAARTAAYVAALGAV